MNMRAEDAQISNNNDFNVDVSCKKTAGGKVTFRRFQPQDESAVREICYNTGFQGKSAGLWLDANQALFTDIWLHYYLTKTPGQVFVAVKNGQIIGYLAGCLEVASRNNYYRTCFPFVLIKGFLNGKYKSGRRAFSALFRHVRDSLIYGRPHARSEKPCAEFHCNMRAEFCGTHERHGLLLTQFFLGEMKSAGLSCLRASAVVRQEEVEGRYRFVAKQYQTSPTTIYADVEAGKYVMVDVYTDFTNPDLPAWWRRFWAKARPLDESNGREL